MIPCMQLKLTKHSTWNIKPYLVTLCQAICAGCATNCVSYYCFMFQIHQLLINNLCLTYLCCAIGITELSWYSVAESGWHDQTADGYKSADIWEVDKVDRYVQDTGEWLFMHVVFLIQNSFCEIWIFIFHLDLILVYLCYV